MSTIETSNNSLIKDASDKEIDWSKLFDKNSNFEQFNHVLSRLVIGSEPTISKKITIALPTFKRQNLLIEALYSVFKQTSNLKDYDVIVVDNSQETSAEQLKEIRKHFSEYSNFRYYVNDENIGMFGNWNRCIELSRSTWVCLLHDDDLISPSFIETFDKLNLEGYSIVFNQHFIQNESKQTSSALFLNNINKLFKSFSASGEIRYMRWSHLKEPSACCALYRRDASIECGGFSSIFADYGFWLKMNKFGKVIKINKQLSSYRISVNESQNIKVQISGFHYMLKIMLSFYEFKPFLKRFKVILSKIQVVYLYKIMCLSFSGNIEVYNDTLDKLNIFGMYRAKLFQNIIFIVLTIHRNFLGNIYWKGLNIYD